MSVTDEYLIRIGEALSKQQDKGELLGLVKETCSVFVGIIPDIEKGLDSKRQRISTSEGTSRSYDLTGDLRKLQGKLLLQKEREAIKALENPLYAVTSKIEADIEKCRDAICSNDPDVQSTAVQTIIRVYEEDIDSIAFGVPGYDYSKEDPPAALLLLIEKLKQYKARILLSHANSSAAPVTVMTSASASSSNTVEIGIVRVSQQINKIPCDSLSEKEKSELRLMLLDLEEFRGHKKSEAETKTKEVLAWIADKGIDAAIAAAPYISSFLQSLI